MGPPARSGECDRNPASRGHPEARPPDATDSRAGPGKASPERSSNEGGAGNAGKPSQRSVTKPSCGAAERYFQGFGGAPASKRRVSISAARDRAGNASGKPRSATLSRGQRQLSFAPSKIQVRMRSRSQIDSCFLPCGIRSSAEARQSSNRIRLLVSGSPGTTIGPNLVPFITP